MHFLPIFLVPLIFLFLWSARQPMEPQQALDQMASLALVSLKGELVGATEVSVETTPESGRIRYQQKGRNSQLWSERGKLWKRASSEAKELLADLGPGGWVAFQLDPQGIVHCKVHIQQADQHKQVDLALPVESRPSYSLP